MRAIRRFLRMYQSLVISGSIVLFCIVALFIGIVPGVKMTIQIIKETETLRNTVKILENKQRVLESLDITMLTTYAKAALSAVPADKNLGSLFSTVDSLTAREGVTVTAVSLGSIGSVATESAKALSQEEKKIGVNIIPFSIVIQGPIEKVRNVVDTAVKIRRFFRVRSFDLGIDAATGITKSTLAMDAYYVPDPKFISKVTDPLKPLTAEETDALDKVSAFPLLSSEEVISTGTAQILTEPSTPDPFSP